jgi:hypothetical protein
MILTVANQLGISYQAVVDLMMSMRDEMFARGECAENGGATIANMAKELRNRGADIAVEWDYQGDQLPQDWHTLLRQNAGIKPILLQVAHASSLVTASGTPEDGGVDYHAIAVVGIRDTGNRQDSGYYVCDPDRPAGSSTIDIYPMFALEFASICGLIMLNVKGESAMALPGNYTDDGDKITYKPNGHFVRGGLAAWVRAHPEFLTWAGDLLGEEEHKDIVGMDPSHGPGWEQYWAYTGLVCFANTGSVQPLWIVPMLQSVQSQLAAAQSQLQNQPPVQAPVDDKAHAVVVAMKAALEALA